MKKRKVAVALGLCLAVGLCGAGLAACGEDPASKPSGGGGGAIDFANLTISDTNSNYYLAGKSKSELFTGAFGEWSPNGTTAASVPSNIALKTTDKANIYALTVDLFEGDQFQILVVGQEWSGQMGADKIVPALKDGDPLGSADGIVNPNIQVNQDGNYTIALKVDDKKGNTISYVRNGDATPFATQYNYWIMGEKVSGGKAMYNSLTAFKTDKNKTVYTTTLNLDANEQFSILAAPVNDGNNGSNITQATLKTGAAISAVSTPSTQAEEENKGPVYQYQAGEAGSYTITITETDALDSTGKTMVTTRSINATKAETVKYDIKFRSQSYGDSLLRKYEWDFTYNSEKDVYEFSFEAVEKEPAAPTSGQEIPAGAVTLGVGNSYAVSVVKEGDSALDSKKIIYKLETDFAAAWDKITYGIDHTSNTVKETGNYTISINPKTFEVTTTREGEEKNVYRVYAHGSYGGAGWADNSTSALAIVGENDSATATITLNLKNGDEFGFRTYIASNYGKAGDQLDWASAGSVETLPEQLKGVDEGGKTGNFKAQADGTYTFTITVQKDGKIVTTHDKKDENGDPVKEKDKDGNVVKDKDGNDKIVQELDYTITVTYTAPAAKA